MALDALSALIEVHVRIRIPHVTGAYRPAKEAKERRGSIESVDDL